MMNEWLDEIKLLVACKLDRDESLQCSSLKPLFYFFGGCRRIFLVQIDPRGRLFIKIHTNALKLSLPFPSRSRHLDVEDVVAIRTMFPFE
jgi:hypothetical protein